MSAVEKLDPGQMAKDLYVGQHCPQFRFRRSNTYVKRCADTYGLRTKECEVISFACVCSTRSVCNSL